MYHIKYEACDHALVEELCKIIKAKTRNPEHENHQKWLARVERAIQEVSCYDTNMKNFSHGNKYKELPTELMLRMLTSLKEHPGSNEAVSFEDVKTV